MEIEGYENYLIYDDGRVYNKKFNKFMSIRTPNSGYKYLNLWENGKRKTLKIHRLVALQYIPNPENKPQVDHFDRDRSNNHVSNLRWVTSLENHQNKGNNKRNTSGVKNVCVDGTRWRYCKMVHGITHRQNFKTFEDAVEYKTKFETIHNIS